MVGDAVLYDGARYGGNEFALLPTGPRATDRVLKTASAAMCRARSAGLGSVLDTV